MLDVWKMALENMIHEPARKQQEDDLRRVTIGLRQLGRVQSVTELRRCYARVQSAMAPPSPQILDAAFGLRYLEIVTRRPVNVRACRYLSWLLVVAD